MTSYLRSKDSSTTDDLLRAPTTLWHTDPNVFESSFNFVAGFLVAGP